jgi:thiol:disulfide interchange protein DsbD
MRTYFLLILMAFTLVVAPAAMADDAHAHPSADIRTILSKTALHPGDKATLAVEVTVHPGLHVQSRTPLDDNYVRFDLAFKAKDQTGATVGPVEYPAGEEKHYPQLGDLSIYEGTIVLRVPITVNEDAKPGTVRITGRLTYQACNDSACFQPEHPLVELTAQVVPADQPVHANPDYPSVAATAAVPTVVQSNTPTLAPTEATDDDATFFGINLLKADWPLVFGAAFVIGIIFNLMPCVLPVLPLKIMGFYEGSRHNRARSVALGAVFSAGLIASFGVLALLVFGTHQLKWGDLFKHTWFTITISGVLAIMAVSTFGFFTVKVPDALYSVTPRHDTYVGNFLFGVLTAALSTPCTFGAFVGLLIWGARQPGWVGGSALVMVGVGMASPYFLLSAFPEVARKFPRAGPWAEVVKQMMAFLLLATAVYFARPLFQQTLSENAFWWSLFGVLAAGAVFLVVRSFQLSSNLLPRSIATALAVVVVVPTFYVTHLLTEKPFEWTPYTDQALASARASGKPVLIDFTASWCGNCHYIEAFVLHSLRVKDAIHSRDVVMLQADVTKENPQAATLLGKLNPAGSIPVTAVYLPNRNNPVVLKDIYKASDLLNILAGKQ